MKANGEFRAEKGIPIPPHRGNKGYTDAMRSLKKGESVMLPIVIANAVNSLHHAGFSAETHTCRTVEGGTRIWRIA